jgi:hypothetical protein
MKKFVSGVIVGAIIATTGAASAGAIDVSFAPIKFFVNGVDKTPANNQFDNNGVKVPSQFIYNGTTYVPLRMVSNLLGVGIQYDGANQAIRLGEEPSGTYLSDLGAFYSATGKTYINENPNGNQSWLFYDRYTIKMGNKEYSKGVAIYSNNKVSYNLNGQYRKLTSLVGIDDRQAKSPVIVTILGDGTKLWEGTFEPGHLPKNVEVDVTGVLQLQIQTSETDSSTSIIDFANPLLTK